MEGLGGGRISKVEAGRCGGVHLWLTVVVGEHVGGDGDGGEERKPMPKYPRAMLQLMLSDGASVLPGIEVERLPQFELGETPLGCKVSYAVASFSPLSAHVL